jgi:L-alanine-DL-glutamate epimerase-like enolase superfamily enzyme
MRMRLHVVDLPLRHTFTIAHGSTTVQQSVIVELDDGRQQGFGEGCPSAYHGVSAEQIAAELEAARELIESTPLASPERYWQNMLPRLGKNRFALCALDQAAHDLFGKRAGQPVHRLWGLSTENLPPSDYTIGLDTVENMVAKLQEFPGWPVYKIKLGGGTTWRSSANSAESTRRPYFASTPTPAGRSGKHLSFLVSLRSWASN